VSSFYRFEVVLQLTVAVALLEQNELQRRLGTVPKIQKAKRAVNVLKKVRVLCWWQARCVGVRARLMRCLLPFMSRHVLNLLQRADQRRKLALAVGEVGVVVVNRSGHQLFTLLLVLCHSGPL